MRIIKCLTSLILHATPVVLIFMLAVANNAADAAQVSTKYAPKIESAPTSELTLEQIIQSFEVEK